MISGDAPAQYTMSDPEPLLTSPPAMMFRCRCISAPLVPQTGSSSDGWIICATDQAAERVPEAKYILAHAIGCGPTPAFVPWANMFLDTLAGLFPSFPDNFWVEIRDFHCPALARTLAEVPATRLLAGTDWTTRVGPPFQSYGTMFDVSEGENPFPARVSSFVEFLRKAGASDEAIDRIGSLNAIELFRLPPTA